jgi:hypothetical protein
VIKNTVYVLLEKYQWRSLVLNVMVKTALVIGNTLILKAKNRPGIIKILQRV